MAGYSEGVPTNGSPLCTDTSEIVFEPYVLLIVCLASPLELTPSIYFIDFFSLSFSCLSLALKSIYLLIVTVPLRHLPHVSGCPGVSLAIILVTIVDCFHPQAVLYLCVDSSTTPHIELAGMIPMVRSSSVSRR